MTGTLPSLPLAQHIDENGLPQSGCRLFLYEANTSTPVVSYKDYLLSAGMEHPNPIVGNALGRIPMFWLPDGFYRARLEDRYGTPLIDEPQLPALGTGEGEGGEPPASAIQWLTGDFLWQPVAGVREGWVRANARTIGSALSGASERANADCAALFSWLWNTYSDLWCPVSGGRGANGPADFNNNKRITMLDLRSVMGGMGMDGMGNVLRGGLANTPVSLGTTDSYASYVGANAQMLTVPYHTHGASTSVSVTLGDPGHYHNLTNYVQDGPFGSGAGARVSEVATFTDNKLTGVYVSSATGSTTIIPTGGTAAQNNVPYSSLGTWYVRL